MLLPLLTESRNKHNSFCSEEAAFHLNGLVNKQYVRYSSEENPWVTIATVMQSPKLHACCSMSESRVISPYFVVDDDDDDDDTINGRNFHSMLKIFFCS